MLILSRVLYTPLILHVALINNGEDWRKVSVPSLHLLRSRKKKLLFIINWVLLWWLLGEGNGKDIQIASHKLLI